MYLISQTRRELVNPWRTFVSVADDIDEDDSVDVISDELERMSQITEDWLVGDVEMV